MVPESKVEDAPSVLTSLGARSRREGGYVLTDPRSRRKVTITGDGANEIFKWIRPEMIATYLKATAGRHPGSLAESPAALAMVDEIMATRKNLALHRLIAAQGKKAVPTITLPPMRFDTASGYYYPEKGRTAWFRAFGSISVDPHRLVPLGPRDDRKQVLANAMDTHRRDPYTVFGLVGHGAFEFLLQAKRLNGRKYLFGKLIHDGRRAVEMTHWARMMGANAATLIKQAGIGGITDATRFPVLASSAKPE